MRGGSSSTRRRRVYSIDEWTVQLRGEERQPEHAHRLAQAIQQAMLREFGPWLTCSIGLASTRLLAKIASKLHKPRGLRVLADAELPQAIEHLPLDGLSGINRGIVARLHRHGIENVRRLWELDRDQLARIWGAVTGAQWWDGLHGVDQPEPPTRRRSMSNGHVLEPRFRAPESARSLLARLVCKLAQRLRRNRFCARRLQLQLLEESGAVWLDDIAVPRSQDTVTLLELFSILWQRRQGGFRHIKKVNVCVAGLEPASQVPRSLFEEDEKRQRLSHTIDAINHRQGEFKVYFGTLHDYRQPMEDKIAFGRIPRKDAMDRGAGFDALQQPVMNFDIGFRPCFHEPDLRAESPGFADPGPRFHSAAFGLVTGGDHAGKVGLDRDDAQRAAAPLRLQVLLRRGEEGVHIRKQPVQAHGGARKFRREAIAHE